RRSGRMFDVRWLRRIRAPPEQGDGYRQNDGRKQGDEKGRAISVSLHVCVQFVVDCIAFRHGSVTPVSRSNLARADSCSTNSLRYSRSRFSTSRNEEIRLSKSWRLD